MPAGMPACALGVAGRSRRQYLPSLVADWLSICKLARDLSLQRHVNEQAGTLRGREAP